MREELKSYLVLAAGIADVPRQRALAAARALATSGEATADQVAGLAEDLLAQSRQNREAVSALVAFEVERTLGRLGLANADDVAVLRRRVAELERQLADARAATSAAGGPKAHEPAPRAAPVGKAPATKAAAKAAPAKKATKSASSKSAPTKKAAKKAPAKPSPQKASPAGSAAESAPDAVVATPASPA